MLGARKVSELTIIKRTASITDILINEWMRVIQLNLQRKIEDSVLIG
jgi:hypothetical protein